MTLHSPSYPGSDVWKRSSEALFQFKPLSGIRAVAGFQRGAVEGPHR